MGAEAAAFAALLLLAFAGKRDAQQTNTNAGGGASAGAGGGSTGGDLGGKIAAGAGGLLGLLGSGGALTGGGTVAGGGAVAVGGGTAAGGGTATAGGGTVAAGGTAAGGSGGSAVTGGALTGVAASGAGATGAIVGVIVAFIIADQVKKALDTAKDFQSAALNLNVNAKALNDFEAAAVRGYLSAQGRTYTEVGVRDFRLDRVTIGQQISFRGYRSVISTYVTRATASKSAGDVEVMARIRAIAFEYLKWRAAYGWRLIRAWHIVPNPPADFGWTTDLLGSIYEAQLPGVGNLLNVPHAFRGETVLPRADREEVLPNPLELVGTTGPINYPNVTLTAEEVRAAKLSAICDAAFICRWDTRGLDADPALYAKALCDGLQWNGATVPGLELRGETIYLNPAEWGVAMYINPTAIRQGGGGGYRVVS